MNFLYVGDIHESDDIPSSRKDDFLQTKVDKINEITSLAKKYNVQAILEGGDFLSKPSFKSEFISQLLIRWLNCDLSNVMFELLNSKNKNNSEIILKKIKECTPLIGIVGNHELYGNNLRTLPKTMIQFLNNIGFLHFATKEKPIIFKTEDGLTVAITGTHYHNGMDKPENINDYVVEKKLGDIHIHIVHGMLMNKSVGDLYRHTLIDDVAKLTKADLTISGHDHLGFPLTEIDGKYFVNPGSPFRNSASLKELKRKPKILLITIDKENGLKIKDIYLKSAKEGSSVLDRNKIEEQIQRKEKLEEIKSLVIKADLKKGIDIKTIIENIANNDNVSEDIKNSIIDEVTKKIEEMDDFYNTECEDYYISEIYLKNFQSHKDTRIKLDKGLNVFIGESRQGKTAILRALDFVIENKYKGNVRRYITKGEDECEVSLYLSNGFIITRVVERKSNGKNGYRIFNPKTGTISEFNTKGLKIVQELLGFSMLNIDKDLSVPLNFLRQGESWFLIGDKYTATQREKIIGGIYGTHYIDAVIRNYEKKEKSISSSLKNKKEDKLKLQEQLDKYSNLDSLEIILDKINIRKKKIELLKSEIDSIKVLKDKIDKSTNQIKEIDNILKMINNLNLVSEKIEIVKNLNNDLNSLENINLRRIDIIKKGLYCKQTLDKLAQLNDINLKLTKIKSVNDEREKLTNNLNEYESKIKIKSKLDKDIKLLEYNINALSNLDEIINKYKVLKNKENELVNYKDIVSLIKEKNNKTLFLKKELNTVNYILKNTSNLDILKDKISMIKEKESNLEVVTDINNKRNEIISLGKQAKENIECNKKNLIEKINEYKSILLEKNTCPLCQSEISVDVINSIIDRFVK